MSTCRSCGAKIKWLTTVNGKKMPVDPESVDPMEAEEGDLLVCEETGSTMRFTGKQENDRHGTWYVSHFANCPQGEEWRKKK